VCRVSHVALRLCELHPTTQWVRTRSSNLWGHSQSPPKELAEPKIAAYTLVKLTEPWKGLCSHEIGLQYRMIFRIDPERRTIEFLAIGTRKVYR
jgi:hypothetical protein